uniref:Rad51 domain-containing protein n=1 Tax=Panagrellus redivivus TaxID=6233 RepID=A0A7E4WC60_PANRE
MNDPVVGLSVSPLKPFEKLIRGFKQFKLDTMVMQVLPAGLILIKSDGGETIDFKATINSLPILEDIDEPVDSDIIRLDTDVLHTFFSSLPEDVPRFSIPTETTYFEKFIFQIGLICIESFGELIKDDPEQHFMHLDVLGKQLVEIAYEKKCIVICVNHATSRPTANGFQLVSALGAEWGLYSAFRLFFVSSTDPDHSKVGTLTLKKWPTATADNWYYRLTASGFVSFISAA